MLSKICTSCRLEKPVSEYHKAKLGKYGVKSICKPCNLGEFKEYRAKNPEKRRATQRNWEVANQVGNKAKRDAKGDIKRAVARKWAEDNRERSREKTRKWVLDNPERHRANCIARERSVAKATPAWADFEKMRAFYAEAKRLTQETGIEHQVDHIVPLRSKLVCGLHNDFNPQILTEFENKSKGNRLWPDMP